MSDETKGVAILEAEALAILKAAVGTNSPCYQAFRSALMERDMLQEQVKKKDRWANTKFPVRMSLRDLVITIDLADKGSEPTDA